MKYYLYILRSEVRETYYIGYSTDPERRCWFHNNESKKAYTKRYKPWEIVYRISFETMPEAMAAERKVKGWKSKKMLRLLIEGVIKIEDYL
ncbi:MAG: GIY-YIG nuclease family protein [Balneolaceae bacterium]|nr:GIY-YIG nuclease family protein [Balneolaceae bacterium]